jgi:hypothetical protein
MFQCFKETTATSFSNLSKMETELDQSQRREVDPYTLSSNFGKGKKNRNLTNQEIEEGLGYRRNDTSCFTT